MTRKRFTFTGSVADGPDIDLVAMSGLKFTVQEQERLWRHIDPRTFLIEYLNMEETIRWTRGEDESSNNAELSYSYNSREGFIYALRNGLLALLRESETIRYREAQMPNHKLKRNLLAVGHSCFVTYYSLFANRNISREKVVATLLKETGYTEQSCLSRTVKARRILDAERGVDALRLIVSSPSSRVSSEIRERAESILKGQTSVRDRILTNIKNTLTRTKSEPISY
ncbi:MAG: hypothetical protein AB8B81_20070 [Halioglobus sp.]